MKINHLKLKSLCIHNHLQKKNFNFLEVFDLVLVVPTPGGKGNGGRTSRTCPGSTTSFPPLGPPQMSEPGFPVG